MIVKLDIRDDCVDRIVIAELRRTLKSHADPEWKEPDSPEIVAACRRLIKYYGPLKS